MELYKKIISRRTIRKFSQEKIDQGILKRLVNAGRLAPSAANLQPLKYIVVDDKDIKEEIFPNLAWAGYITPPAGEALPTQPPEALQAIRFFAGPIPALLLVLAIVCAWFYPITRESHRALRDELAGREA